MMTGDTQKRPWLIELSVIVFFITAALAGDWLAGYIYGLLNKSVTLSVSLETWWQHWRAYAVFPDQRKKLQLAAIISGVIVFLIPILILTRLLSVRTRSLHGDARFANGREIAKAGLFGEAGIFVGQYRSRYLIYGGQQFVLLAAPTRSGKGVGVVIPNLLNFSGSVVVLDIKLENFKLTSAFRAHHGQKVFLFNPFAEDFKTHRWNPLDGVSRDRNYRVGDIMAIGQALYPHDQLREAFWNDQARNLFLGLVLYLLDTPTLPCTLGEVLRQSSGKGQPIQDHIKAILSSRAESKDKLGPDCIDALNRFCHNSENTLASIVASFNAPLGVFANPITDAATSASDFDLGQVRKQRLSIYIGIQPGRLADAALLINLLFSQLINANTKALPQKNPELKFQCLMILDEFTAMGRIGVLAKANAFMAGYNLRLLTIVQSLSQLEAVYGPHDTRTLVSNHALSILYQPREQSDARAYSEILGYYSETATSRSISQARGGRSSGSSSENTSNQRRALMLPQELRELGDDRQIILIDGMKPFLSDKARYYSDPNFMKRLITLSPSLKTIKSQLPSQAQLEDAAFVKGELSASVPSLDLSAHFKRLEQNTEIRGKPPIQATRSKSPKTLTSDQDLSSDHPSQDQALQACGVFEGIPDRLPIKKPVSRLSKRKSKNKLPETGSALGRTIIDNPW